LERLGDLLFEVSNEDRLRILNKLDEKPLKITNLSRELDLTNQECSRHVTRLGDVGLTMKDADGFHRLTFYGELVLRMVPGLAFVSEHGDYFRSHSLEMIPQEFVTRIGELKGSSYVDDVMVVFHNVERIILDAEEYVWRLTDRYLMTALDELEEAVKKGVEVRLLEPRDIVFPPGWNGAGPVIEEATTRGQFLNRLLERTDVFIAMSEKEVAGISFPLRGGRFDYFGFHANDERSHRWCKELFQHYWERSESRQQ